jgi:hypothetical protein
MGMNDEGFTRNLDAAGNRIVRFSNGNVSFYVYNISDTETSNKLGIALIPNLKISHMCSDLINDNPVKFNCVFNDKFKKWVPINPI